MLLLNARDQNVRDDFYVADGTITSGNSAQLLLPESKSRSYLYIQNLSAHTMYVEFGGARATATITSGAVTSFSITNAGFGYTIAPTVHLLGGGSGGNATSATNAIGGIPTWPSPGDNAFVGPRLGSTTDRRARAHCTLSAGAVNAFVIDDPGSGYINAPYVFLQNSLIPPDPFGVAIPSSSSGYALAAVSTTSNTPSYLQFNGTACPTSAVAIVSSGTSDAFVCRWLP